MFVSGSLRVLGVFYNPQTQPTKDGGDSTDTRSETAEEE